MRINVDVASKIGLGVAELGRGRLVLEAFIGLALDRLGLRAMI
jgi:hypothetical protein